MEIERINEHTVKFYISYVDIEERGFDRDEIWYNRDRSEELFWEMMDEIHYEEEFAVEGPLWIQVQALDKGLEIMVTKAQLTKDGQKLELPISEDKLKDMPVDERIESLLDQHFQVSQSNEDVIASEEEPDVLECTVMFRDFEDVISLSKRMNNKISTSSLYSYEDKYYLYIEFKEDEEGHIDDILSVMMEYGDDSSLTIHRLKEYGKEIIAENVFDTINRYFK
ncbi:MAG: adaptor protein MecA [Bacillus sp. (in: firmicutes)]